MDREIIIEAKKLTKIFKLYVKPADRLMESLDPFKKKRHVDFYALNDVSFRINKGETIGIVGQNGSGKSMLLKVLTKILTPTSGSFFVNGRISALLELGAGFNGEYTGEENIYLHGEILGIPRKKMEERAADIMRFADIGDFIRQPVKTYSSGMFVRLAFAVAINVDPDILIIDEALSVGDVFFQLKCYKKINDFKNAGKTMILVTHDHSSVIKYCDRAFLMAGGELIAQGDPKEIIDEYKKSVSGADITINDETHEENVNENAEWKSSLSINPDRLEYGNYKAKIIDFAVVNHAGKITTALEKGRGCKIIMKVRFFERIDEPIFAIAVKDSKGLELTGTNTMIESFYTGEYDAGETVEVTFEQDFNLQGGNYYLSLGCTKYEAGGDLTVFHRLYDVVAFEILSKKVSTGFFDMNSEIKAKKVKADAS